ncbi:MAG: glycosyltransferase family 4 protein [Pseudohongiellaceae bacterium]
MRITYLHQYFNTPKMSGGTRSYEMARRLVDMGHEVNIVTSWRESDERQGWFETTEAGITVHWLPVPYVNHMSYAQRIRAFFYFAWKASRKAASLPADVVFATSTPLTIALPGAYAARHQNVPLVFEVRDLWPEVPIALGALRNPLSIWAARRLELFAYRSSARVVALAPGMKRGVEATSYPGNRVDIVPNGCDDVAVGDATIHNSPPWHAELPVGRKCIAYVGTIGIANGVGYIPALAAAGRQQMGNSAPFFIIAGDGKEMIAVREEARRLGVLNRDVIFLGAIPKSQIWGLLKSCCATIMTYDGPEILYRDSVSNKFFDSLAAGLPVFANFAGFSTLVAQSVGAGCILSCNSHAGAKELISRVNDPVWMKAASSKALCLANDKFSRNRLASYLEQVLLKATNNRLDEGEIVGAEFEELEYAARAKP